MGRANGNDSLKNCRVYDSCYFTFTTAFENKINIGSLVGSASDISIISCESDADILALGTAANAGSLAGLINGESVLYNSVGNSEIAIAGDSFGALFGEGHGSVTVVGCKNETALKDYNLADGAQLHTATKFTKKDGTSHTAKCECGKDIELQCVKSEYGYCKYCELDITGASVSLKSDVAINYFVSIKDKSITQGKTLAMEFTMNGETVNVTEHYLKDGKMVFTLGGILHRQIGDIIDAKLVILEENSTKVIASKLGYSVRENCLALLKGTDDEKLSALINALLEYASKEQAYLDYKTDRFVAGGVSIPVFDGVPDKEDRKVFTANNNADYKITGAYAKVDSSLALRIEMNILDLSAVTVTLNGTELDKTKLVSLGEGKYALEVKNFAPYLLNGEIEVCIVKDGNAEAKVLFGADSHLYSLIQDKKQIEQELANYKPVTKKVDEAEFALFLSIYRYGLAAEEYYNHLAEVSK